MVCKCKKCGKDHVVEQYKYNFRYYYCIETKRVIVLSDERQIQKPEKNDESVA
jgi:hypothetical protein